MYSKNDSLRTETCLNWKCFCFVSSCCSVLPGLTGPFYTSSISSTVARKGFFAFLTLGRTAQKLKQGNEHTNIGCSSHRIWAVTPELDLVFPAKCIIYLCHHGAALGGGILGKQYWLWQVPHESQDDSPHNQRSL